MRVSSIIVAATIGALLVWGCEDSKTPTAPRPNPPEFVATVNVDSCADSSPGEPLDQLCGGSSDIRASFDFIYDDVRHEYPGPGYTTKEVQFRTGPGTWEFSRHDCTGDCGLSEALNTLFAGRPLRMTALRRISPTGGITTLVIDVIAGDPAVAWALSFPVGQVEMPVDADGFPVIDGDLTLNGPFQIATLGGGAVWGTADVTIERWTALPVHHKSEPPVVARPVYTVSQLRGAPPGLELGGYTLAFEDVAAVRPALDVGITVSVSIWEQSLNDFDQGRFDFLWVVNGMGEVWEPDIPGVWDFFRLDASASDGPQWNEGTDVDVVAGIVDLNGDVHLLGIAATIEAGGAAPVTDQQ